MLALDEEEKSIDQEITNFMKYIELRRGTLREKRSRLRSASSLIFTFPDEILLEILKYFLPSKF